MREIIRDGETQQVISDTFADIERNWLTVIQFGQTVIDRPLTLEERQRYGPQPLEPLGAAMTLLAVLGVVPLIDAANAVGLTLDALVAEAQAWAAAAQLD